MIRLIAVLALAFTFAFTCVGQEGSAPPTIHDSSSSHHAHHTSHHHGKRHHGKHHHSAHAANPQ